MDFDFEESTGTRRFLALLCDSFQDLNHDRVMIVDELEESLHPLLVRNFVARFAEDREQAKTAISQLLFTTHNPLLLDQTLLRRDQIWFTEKDQEGATRLYPLTDFKPRKDESLVKGYLAGRYGGIPFIPEGMKF
jgi:AAA15 family ATPase/GTPase